MKIIIPPVAQNFIAQIKVLDPNFGDCLQSLAETCFVAGASSQLDEDLLKISSKKESEEVNAN